jgi:mRNA interferase MazF
MKLAGQVVLFRFPQTDLISGKLRPALLIQRAPGPRDDWLICMISSQTQQFIPDFDEIVEEDSEDFAKSGLKVPSVIRIGRLAVKVRRNWCGEYKGCAYAVAGLEYYECANCGEKIYDRQAMRKIEACSPAFASHRPTRKSA